MKRSLESSDSLGALMTMCPSTDEHGPRNNNNNHAYAREFQAMMLDGVDEEGCVGESNHLLMSEKKRRLSVDQVKALEKNFEVENKLEPERKVKLAQELGLQPRQVAVWFQNRRARWKTKQLERDYGVLKANYDALKVNFDTIQQNKEALLKEIKELKSRLQEEQTESDISVKEETTGSDSDEKKVERSEPPPAETSIILESECNNKDLNYGCFNGVIGGGGASLIAPVDHFKDGASDSDSSAILNEDNSPNATISSPVALQSHDHHLLISPSSPSSSMNCFQFQRTYQSQYVKMEEHNFFSAEEACNFFSEDQAPTLQWYCSDHHWT